MQDLSDRIMNYGLQKPADQWFEGQEAVNMVGKALRTIATDPEFGSLVTQLGTATICLDGGQVAQYKGKGDYIMNIVVMSPARMQELTARIGLAGTVCSFEVNSSEMDIPGYRVPQTFVTASIAHELYHAKRCKQAGVVPNMTPGDNPFDSDEVAAHEVSLRMLAKLTDGATTKVIEPRAASSADVTENIGSLLEQDFLAFEKAVGSNEPGMAVTATLTGLLLQGVAYRTVELHFDKSEWPERKLAAYRLLKDLPTPSGFR